MHGEPVRTRNRLIGNPPCARRRRSTSCADDSATESWIHGGVLFGLQPRDRVRRVHSEPDARLVCEGSWHIHAGRQSVAPARAVVRGEPDDITTRMRLSHADVGLREPQESRLDDARKVGRSGVVVQGCRGDSCRVSHTCIYASEWGSSSVRGKSSVRIQSGWGWHGS